MAGLRDLDPRVKAAGLVALAIASVAILSAVGPIERRTYVANFPDTRTLLGIPNFFNVLSNLPFAIVGALGLASLAQRPRPLRPALAVLYAGIFLTGFGSAFHHLAPSFDRLLFDRLPMTLAFASVFAVAVADRIEPRAAAVVVLAPLVAVAAGSAVYWYGTGQLRPYIFVQGFPMIAIPAMLLLYRGRHLDGRHFFAAVAIYGAAKLAERYDPEIYELGRIASGHTVKHLLAGWATWHLVLMARRS